MKCLLGNILFLDLLLCFHCWLTYNMNIILAWSEWIKRLKFLFFFFFFCYPHFSSSVRLNYISGEGRGNNMEKFNKECTISFIKIRLSVVSSLVKTLQLLVWHPWIWIFMQTKVFTASHCSLPLWLVLSFQCGVWNPAEWVKRMSFAPSQKKGESESSPCLCETSEHLGHSFDVWQHWRM